MQFDISWNNIIDCLHNLKQCFIWFNFTMSMIIFVPYMTLIVLDITVYLWRLTNEYISTLLTKSSASTCDTSDTDDSAREKEKRKKT